MLPYIHSLKCKKEAYPAMVIGHILSETVKHEFLKIFVVYVIYIYNIYDIYNIYIFVSSSEKIIFHQITRVS